MKQTPQLLTDVLARAGGGCECRGRCASRRCRRGEACYRAPDTIHAAPADPLAGWVAAARAGPDGLIALCGPCRSERDRAARRAAARRPDSGAAALFDP